MSETFSNKLPSGFLTIIERHRGWQYQDEPRGANRPKESSRETTMLLYLIWQCLKCGYTTVGKDPPDRCPECHAPREEFVLVEED